MIEYLLQQREILKNRLERENQTPLYPPPGYKYNHALVRALEEEIEKIDRDLIQCQHHLDMFQLLSVCQERTGE